MTDCIVVGGGLIGMLTARALHDVGADVLLVDKGRLGGEASWAGGGILTPLYPWRYPKAVDRLAHAGQVEYARFSSALKAETGIDPEWIQSGLLVLDTDERQAAETWAATRNLRLAHLQGSALHDCEPALAKGFQEGLWLPEIAQIRNPRMIKALRASLERRGINWQEHIPVTGVEIRAGKVIGVSTPKGTLRAESVVLASGAWSAQLLPSATIGVDIEPVRGQMLVFQADEAELTRIVLDRGQYLIPRRDGLVLAGSTIEHVGFDTGTTTAARRQLQIAACEIMPRLARCPIVHHWSGLRPSSPQGIPYIGVHPEIAGLYINAGHFRYGVILALASVTLLTDIMRGRPTRHPPGPYGITRAPP